MNTLFRIKIAMTALLLSFAMSTLDASDKERKVSFAYDVDFEMNFDNREFYRSAFSRSMTIFGARLTPSVGLSVTDGKQGLHKVMFGADVMKDFGGSGKGLVSELTLYYKLHKQVGDTDVDLYAGVFPRRFSVGSWSEAFFSDSLVFYDNNLEGLLVRFTRPKASFEVGCDWMGQYGPESRERFMVFSSGEGKVAPILYAGYSAYMYHFANSHTQKGVVDNVLMNPYVRFELGHLMSFQTFSLRFGWLQGMQHDRAYVDNFVFPGGGEFDFEMRRWNVGLINSLFCGTDMMPYYNNLDNTGAKYGSEVYMGSPFYRVFDGVADGIGLYDRLEVFYEPSVGKYLKIRIGAAFHFNNQKYSGCQQMVSLKFNLQELLRR